MTPKQSDFRLKYGDGSHIDKLLRIDHPTWPQGRGMEAIRPALYSVISKAVTNPRMSDKAALKAAAFPHEYTGTMMADYLRHHDGQVHPDVLTAIAKHNGHREFMRSMLADQPNVPKEAWAHMAQHVDNAINSGTRSDATEHLIRERDHYLKKAQ